MYWFDRWFFFFTVFFHATVDASALASVHTGMTQKNNLAKKYSSAISQFAEVSFSHNESFFLLNISKF